MSDDERKAIAAALEMLTTEAFLQAGPQAAWFLNPNDPGFAGELAKISAERASQEPAPGRKTIASHAAHINFHLTLLNRYAAGEPNPFATADWAESWTVVSVSHAAWEDLRGDIERNARTWVAFVRQPREWDLMGLSGAFASAAHAAYHLGAIRQMSAWIASSPQPDERPCADYRIARVPSPTEDESSIGLDRPDRSDG
jgi:hypothetical protein